MRCCYEISLHGKFKGPCMFFWLFLISVHYFQTLSTIALLTYGQQVLKGRGMSCGRVGSSPSPTSCIPHPPTSFATWLDIRLNSTLPEACYLFIPCLLANPGPSREHKKGDGQHQKSGAQLQHLTEWSRPHRPSVRECWEASRCRPEC